MAQKNRTDLTAQANVIKNETVSRRNTALRVGTMNIDEIDSAININDTEPNTWHLNTNGNDANVGSDKFPFENVQAALDVYEAGDTIIIQNQYYSSGVISVTIDKNLVIKGVDTNIEWLADIRGTWTIEPGVELSIENLTLHGVGFSTSGACTLFISNCHGNNVDTGTSTTNIFLYLQNCASFELVDGKSLRWLQVQGSHVTKNINVGFNVNLFHSSCVGNIVSGLSSTQPMVLYDSTIKGNATVTGDLEKYNSVITGTETVSGTTTSRQAKVFDDNVEFKGQAKAIGGFGESIAFSESIKANAQGYFPDYTQTGVLNFTKDGSVIDNEGYGNGSVGIIIANGDEWTFTDDFNKISDELIPGKSYQFVSWWNGLKMNVVWKIIDSAFTPPNLGTALLNWWDGTIVDESPATEVNSWEDQKGSFDWQNIGSTKKLEYDSANNLIIADSSNLERLSNDANAASFNRSDGEYWFVIDFVTGLTQILFVTSISTLDASFFVLQISTNKVTITSRNEGAVQNIVGTTTLSPGKNIIRIKSTGSGYVVNLNNIDISSEFSSGDGAWESIITPDRISLAALIKTSSVYSDERVHEILRCDETLTSEEVTNMYNYLNAKY